MKDIELGKRIAGLRTGRNLEQKAAAAAIGIKYGTYQHYEYGNVPSRKFLSLILQYYKCSKSWLQTGEGVPYPDKQESTSGGVRETVPTYGNAAQKINIDDAQGKAYRVLSAGNALSVALYMNIQQFAAALDTGKELKICQDQITDLQSQIDELRGQVDRLTAIPSITADPAAGSEEKVA
jgi:transcriptional regulator with XRE-family HTH domain